MADTRIRVAKDKTALVKALRASNDATGPFQSYADVLIFAASLGMQKQAREPIADYSKEIDPIRQDVFYGKGYDQTINLIAIADTSDPRIVANSDTVELQRIKIFEEYINGGLALVENILQGSTDYTERLLLELSDISQESDTNGAVFDLNSYLI